MTRCRPIVPSANIAAVERARSAFAATPARRLLCTGLVPPSEEHQ